MRNNQLPQEQRQYKGNVANDRMEAKVFGAHAPVAQAGLARPDSPCGLVRVLTRANEDRLVWCWLLLVASITGALCLPFLRFATLSGDEGLLFDGVQRMLLGHTIYRDFFEFLPPGSFILTDVWLRIFGASYVSAQSLAILTIVGIACFTFLACRAACRSSWLSAVAAIGWVVTSQGGYLFVSHHWFATLLSMIAASVAIASAGSQERGLRAPFIAGLATGAAGMVIPTCGAYAMIAAFVPFADVWRRPNRAVCFLIGGALVPLGLIGYLLAAGAFAAAFNDVIRFTAAHYASVQWVPIGSGADLQNFPLWYVFPLSAVLLVLLGLTGFQHYVRDRRFQTCLAFSLAGLAGCFPRPDMGHVAFIAPLALPLLVFATSELIGSWGSVYRVAVVVLALSPCIQALGGFAARVEIAREARIQPTPRGAVAVVDDPANTAGSLLARIAASPPGDTYFFYPYLPLAPYLSGRPQQSDFYGLVPGFSLPSQYESACFSVLRKTTWVVIDRMWTNPARWKRIFPAMNDPRPPETVKFEAIIESAFTLTHADGNFELWHRRSQVDPEICASIDSGTGGRDPPLRVRRAPATKTFTKPHSVGWDDPRNDLAPLAPPPPARHVPGGEPSQ